MGLTKMPPFQPMRSNALIQLLQFDDSFHESAVVSHRHDFFMLIWVTDGCGSHYIDFTQYELLPGRLFLITQGQVHRVEKFPQNGWMLLFDETFFINFLDHVNCVKRNGISGCFNNLPFVDLDKNTSASFNLIIKLLRKELVQNRSTIVLQHLVTILLLHATGLHNTEQRPSDSTQYITIKKLKALIEENFKERKGLHFYCREVNLSVRKVNKITMQVLGKTICQLVRERILTESKALLQASSMNVKEIAFSLGFADPSYFCRLFRKVTGCSPLSFRQKHFL